MEKLLRVSHAINRGAGIGGFVICAETTPRDIGKHMELMEKQEFDIELIYWKQASGGQKQRYNFILSFKVNVLCT